MRISFSALDQFERCPLAYKLNYIDRIKAPERPELYFGSLIHKVVQEALRRDPITVPLDGLNQFMEENWREEVFPDKETSEKYKRWGKTMIRNFHAAHKPGLTNIVSTEKRFQIPLGKKHQLTGFIDRIDKLPYGPYEVIDYKTSTKMSSQDDLNRNKQLSIYHYATKKLWPDAKDVRLSLYFLKFGNKLSTKRDDADIEIMIKDVEKTADKIEKISRTKKESDFPPKPNYLCDWCDYGDRCPMMKAKFPPKADQLGAGSKQARELIEEYIKSHQKIRDLEPRIHEHFDNEEIERFFTKYGIVTRSPKTKKLTIRKVD
jgi:RecB family exonuclease